MPGLPIAHPHTTLHLYRHLLREASYLPPVVKPFFLDRIRTRFRQHQRDPEPQGRVHRANQDLRYLRSANGGHLLRMRRVLMMGFGRTGRRRRELINQLSQKKPESGAGEANKGAELATIGGTSDSPSDDVFWDDWLSQWDQAKLLALAKAQSAVDLPETSLPTGKFADPHKLVPTENIWGKPLARKLARSKLRKEYKSVIKRLLPPVEDSEWELLRALATGQVEPEYDVPKRRTVASGRQGATHDEWKWKDYVLKPVRAVDANKSRSLKSLTGEVDDTSPFPRPAVGLHRFTSRSWRRLYAEIWRMTPTMRERENKQGWVTKWGKPEVLISRPSAPQAEFFQGVASTGKVQG